MNNINLVALCGNLTAKPEIRYTPKGSSVAQFSVAVTESYQQNGQTKETTTFIDCTAWAGMADKVAGYDKGQPVYVVGKLRKDSWDDKQSGQKRYKTYVLADAVTSAFVGSKQPATQSSAPQKQRDDDLPL